MHCMLNLYGTESKSCYCEKELDTIPFKTEQIHHLKIAKFHYKYEKMIQQRHQFKH